jgi:hypothetical protein
MFILMTALSLTVTASSIFAQRLDKSCSNIKYESRNQVNPDQLWVRIVWGKVIDAPNSGAGQPVSAVCIGIFDEKTKKLVSSIEGSHDGHFGIKKLKDGNFRLVVQDIYHSYCVANLRVRVDHNSRETRQIIVHMRLFPNPDKCSYGELAKGV